jgi:hypothetical protein
MTLADEITNHVISLIMNAEVSSANPAKTNYVKDVNAGRLNASFQEELVKTVEELVSEYIIRNPTKSEEKIKHQKKKKDESSIDKILEGAELGMDPFDVIQQYGSKLAKKLIPHLIAVGIAEKVFEVLQETGGPLETKIRIYVEKQVNGLMARQNVKNLSIGIDGITLQGEEGFRNINGMASYDTLRQIREGTGAGFGLSSIDYKDQVHKLWDVRK